MAQTLIFSTLSGKAVYSDSAEGTLNPQFVINKEVLKIEK
jgi:hypothetical protein